MKKFLAVLLSVTMAFSMLFVFTACGDDEGDKDVNANGEVVTVTDESGEAVTDDKGEPVTEVINNGSNGNNSNNNNSNGNNSNGNNSNSSSKNTTKNTSNGTTANNSGNSSNTTTKKTDSKTTTKSPVASSADAKKLVGSWKATIPMMTDDMLASLDEMADYFDFRDCSINVNIVFGSDGTYELSYDEASAKNAIAKFKTALKKALEDYFKDTLGSNINLNDALAMVGMDFDELLDTLVEELESELSGEAETGVYKFESGKFYMSEGSVIDENTYYSYEFNGNQFKITEALGTASSDIDMMLPLVFTKK